jgi:phospholipid/cholesterol/gamma-HCH transport system substrate-binding protein
MNTQVKVGIFFVVGLLILLAVFDFVGDIPFFRNDYSLKTYFSSIGELREGNPVKLEGYDIGKVSKIRVADRKIEVQFRVKKGMGIKKDSEASINLTSLLGTSYINLSFGSPDSPVAVDGDILPSKEPADINKLLSKVDSAVGSIDNALGGLDVFGSNKEQLTNIVKNIDIVLEDVKEGKGTIGKLFKDESLYNEAENTFANVNKITTSMVEGKGTLGKLLKDESLYNDAKVALTNLGQLTKKLNTSNGTIGKLINDDTLYNEATGAATHLNDILEKINSGQGTLGQLVNDDKLYKDAQDTLLKVDKSIDTLDDLAPLGVLGTALGVVTLF